MKINERLEYIRPDGVRFMLHAPPTRAVISEEGFGTPPINYVTDRSPYQNGNTVRSFTLDARPVQIVVTESFCSREATWAGRAALLDAIRPNRIIDFNAPGKLRYYRSGGTRRDLDVFLEAGPGFAPPQGGWRAWSYTEVLRWIAQNPTWYDPTLQSLVFTGGTLATFPMTFPVTFTPFGSAENIMYSGTWIAQPTIEIHGPITGVHMHNHTTDDMIMLNHTLQASESVTITLEGNPTVISGAGENWLKYISSDSDLTTFGLVPAPQAPGGINDIHVEGSGIGANTAVSLSWYNRYFGI